MIKINIVKAGNITNSAQFGNKELAQLWLDIEIANRSFGKLAYNEIIFDETGKEVSTIHNEAEYQIEIIDITAEVEQQRINSEAEAYLLSTDWMVIRSIDGIAVPAEVTLERIAARARIVR
jgi:hypothetical protein